MKCCLIVLRYSFLHNHKFFFPTKLFCFDFIKCLKVISLQFVDFIQWFHWRHAFIWDFLTYFKFIVCLFCFRLFAVSLKWLVIIGQLFHLYYLSIGMPHQAYLGDNCFYLSYPYVHQWVVLWLHYFTLMN